jgi:hypothetical protein
MTETLSERACKTAEVTVSTSERPAGSAGGTLRSQVLVSALLVLVAIVGVVVVPAWAESTKSGDGGKRVAFDDGKGSFVPAAGWKRESETTRSMTYQLSGTTYSVDAAQPSDSTVEERIDEAIKVFDDISSWQVDSPVYFTTTSGSPAASVTAHQGDGVWVVAVVADGEWTMRATTIAPDSSWLAVRDDVDDMNLSIELPGANS